jgi:hypothetical protein
MRIFSNELTHAGRELIALRKVLKERHIYYVCLATRRYSMASLSGLEILFTKWGPIELMTLVVKNPNLVPSLESLKSQAVLHRRKAVEKIL